MTDTSGHRLFGVLSLSLFVRLAVVPLSIARMNPYAQADAVAFAEAAAVAADRLAAGSIPTFVITDPTSVWGAFLSPLWLLPGPSLWYAHLVAVLLGVGSLFNVYVMTTRFGSRRAGLLAAAVLGLLPSVVLVQASLLRDGAVLFGLTSVIRLWLAPPAGSSRVSRVVAGLPLLGFTFLLRIENLPLYLLVAAVYVFVSLLGRTRGLGNRLLGAVAIAGAGVLALATLPRAVDRLSFIRRKRARDESVYLPDVMPESAAELLAFSWIGAAYFLFAPFPWMVAELSDLVVMWEGLLHLGALLLGVRGLRRMLGRREDVPAVVALLVGFLAGIVLYGAANANYGTAVRQRQMFLPILYLFGAIGLFDILDIRWGTLDSNEGEHRNDEVTEDTPDPRAGPR